VVPPDVPAALLVAFDFRMPGQVSVQELIEF
jgi:hypothetical protein